ncbi:MAG TPA: gliding motility-associated C-terminal domain-containing protein [Chitinophagaceae bacterium]
MNAVFRNSALFVFLLLSSLNTRAQTATCPENLDFEFGNFSGWVCNSGVVSVTSGANQVLWVNTGEASNRHTIIPATNTDLDKYGLFPVSCPNGSGYSIRLGNDLSGAEADGVSFTYEIPSNITNFSIIYHYAIVLQDPGHNPEQQPRFQAKVYDVADNTQISCVSFDFTSSSSLPGFLPSPGYPQVVYKDWTPITVDLSSFAGRTIRLEFATSDCTLGGHFGYAYVDVSSRCDATFNGSFKCGDDNFVSVTAPYGFLSYTWYSNTDFTQVIGSAQNVLLSPAPPLGSVFPVILEPYPTFGCPDTLYATIASADKPVSFAGPDRVVCSKGQTQLGAPGSPGHMYAWSPSHLVTNHISANPYINTVLTATTTFIVKTTDVRTACFTSDTVVITPFIIDTVSSMTGRTLYCPAERVDNQLTVGNSSATVQWFLDNNMVSGATGHTYRPATAGTYWAQLRQNGCIDSTRQHSILLSAIPNVSFILNRLAQCLNTPVSFTNRSAISTNEPLTYRWQFGDGTFSTEESPVKTFLGTGSFNVSLTASSPAGCTATTQKDIFVLKDCGVLMPSGFTPNNDGLNDLLKPNLSGVKGLKRFAVYNRHGQIVFSTVTEGVGWDGTHKGMKLDSGVYVWIVELITNDDKTQIQKGTITLIR